MRTILVLALWLLAGWNLGAMLEFAVGLPTWIGVAAGLIGGLAAARWPSRGTAGRQSAPVRLSLGRR
jgi:hypothetical protein